mgnify:CR=1 FL=1
MKGIGVTDRALIGDKEKILATRGGGWVSPHILRSTV